MGSQYGGKKLNGLKQHDLVKGLWKSIWWEKIKRLKTTWFGQKTWEVNMGEKSGRLKNNNMIWSKVLGSQYSGKKNEKA